MAEVVGIGALNWDRLLLVDRFAKEGEEIVIKEFREEAGGSAANTIAGLGRLGVKCGFIGKMGSDKEGELILKAFEREGVDTKGIKRVEGRSGAVYAFVDDLGERSMYVKSGVNDNLLLNDINSSYLRFARFIHISSFAGSTSIETIKKIPELKGPAKLSFAPGFLSRRGRDFLTPILKQCEILFLNEKEAAALTGKPPSEAGAVLRREGLETVVVTMGSKGCIVVDEEGAHEAFGIKTTVVDTTGAGDAFAAGFLYGTLKGFDASASARIGNFAASKCIRHIGARKGLPSKGSLKAFLRKIHKCEP